MSVDQPLAVALRGITAPWERFGSLSVVLDMLSGLRTLLWSMSSNFAPEMLSRA
jgi:hypothetical protein